MIATVTLLELLTVVAVLAILTALALPSVYQAQLKAKRAEVPLILDGLRESQMAYHAVFGEFAATPVAHPASVPSKTRRPWDDGSVPPELEALGFWPDGDVYGQYKPTHAVVGPDIVLELFGICNVDGEIPLYNERLWTPVVFDGTWEREQTCLPAAQSCF